MKKALALLLALSMMVSMFAACGSDDSTTSSTTTTDSSDSSDTLVSDGSSVVLQDDVVINTDDAPEGIVAGTSATIVSGADFVTQLLPGMYNGGQFFYSLVYDTLFWSPSGDWNDLEPLMVSDYTISEDGLTWVMNLHENIYFANGNNFNAASVIGSFDYYEENNHGTLLDCVDRYEATGDYQVTLHLNYTNPELSYNLAISNLAMFDHNCYLEYGYTAEACMGAGSGPYYIESYAIGDTVVLKATEDYWMPERQAHIETVTMKIITNPTTAFNALASGEVDFYALSDYNYYELLKDSEDHTIITSAGSSYVVWLNSGGTGYSGVLANANVREALSLLIDDEQVMLAATGGYGTVSGNALNEAFNDYYYEIRTYDPDAGLALLEAEGIEPSDIALTGIVGTGQDAGFINIQSQLMDYGITFDFVATDTNVVMTEGMAGNWDLWTEGGGLGPLPYYCTSQNNLWGPDAAQLVVTDETLHAQISEITTTAISSLTVEDTYAHFAEACQILNENYAYLTTYSGVSWAAFNNRIENFSLDLHTNIAYWRVFDSWIAE